MGHNGILRNDTSDAMEGFIFWNDKRTIKSLIIRRPILLVLEDIDGCMQFLLMLLRIGMTPVVPVCMATLLGPFSKPTNFKN